MEILIVVGGSIAIFLLIMRMLGAWMFRIDELITEAKKANAYRRVELLRKEGYETSAQTKKEIRELLR